MSEPDPVIDASPLIHLARAGKLSLLRELYGSVAVPDAVADEVLKDERDSAAIQLSTNPWLHRAAVETPNALLQWTLGLGETAVIAHASRTHCLAIVDDQAARRCCKALGVQSIGTLGIVLLAARKGFVTEPVVALEEVRATGMWLAEDVFAGVIAIAREIERRR